MSAPDCRVNLVTLKATKARRKEPSTYRGLLRGFEAKSAENGFAAASRAVLVDGTPRVAPITRSIVASGGFEVCDGGHRLGVMKKSVASIQ